jgi:hypothetical protein
MSKLAFTICSNNYLAQAKTLGQTLLSHNPGYQFIICLVDKPSPQIDYSLFQPYEILLIEQVPIPDFESMVLRYNITELNTAVKPFIFKYLFARNTDAATIIYLDPDIQVYDRFTEIENGFVENTFILTPHYTNAINDNFQQSEESTLNCGLYNLGFLGLARKGRVFEFLDWWAERLKDRCYNNLIKGWFVDQIWINFVPLYYEGAFIMRHPGYNMAYWNLHERKLDIQGGKYLVNASYPLVFFHFSGYNLLQPESISKYQNRFSFESRPDLLSIFEAYRNTVWQNGHQQFMSIPCYYTAIYQTAKLDRAATSHNIMMNGTEKSSFKRNVKIILRRILHLDN